MPTWQTINKSGSLLIEDSLTDSPGIRNARKFLNETAIAFIKQCVSFYEAVGEFPFIYRERQLHSALFPAIAKVSTATFMEQPVTRKSKDNIGHGWLDYWVLYGTSVFLIELKHAWNAIKTDTVRSTTQSSWAETQEQLKKISKEDLSNLSISSRSAAKIALMVVPFFQSSVNKDKLQEPITKDEIAALFAGFSNALTPNPDWSCVWAIHQNFLKPVKYQKQFESYPCVGLVATVKTI